MISVSCQRIESGSQTREGLAEDNFQAYLHVSIERLLHTQIHKKATTCGCREGLRNYFWARIIVHSGTVSRVGCEVAMFSVTVATIPAGSGNPR